MPLSKLYPTRYKPSTSKLREHSTLSTVKAIEPSITSLRALKSFSYHGECLLTAWWLHGERARAVLFMKMLLLSLSNRACTWPRYGQGHLALASGTGPTTLLRLVSSLLCLVSCWCFLLLLRCPLVLSYLSITWGAIVLVGGVVGIGGW